MISCVDLIIKYIFIVTLIFLNIFIILLIKSILRDFEMMKQENKKYYQKNLYII